MISFSQFFTEKFNSIVLSQIPSKELGMFNSMVRLPMNKSYGFWMDNHGNFRPVKGLGDHEVVAKDILARANFGEVKSYYDTLLQAGWVRIIITRGKLFWETYPGNSPNSIQKKNMSFMKDFYELSSVEMG